MHFLKTGFALSSSGRAYTSLSFIFCGTGDMISIYANHFGGQSR